MTKGLYGLTNSGLIVPKEHAQIRVAANDADIVLDPVCGSGTTAQAASELHRRFICIDRESAAINLAWNRLHWAVKQRTVIVEWLFEKIHFIDNPMLWDSGCNFLVIGDSIEVLRSMPDSFVALVYADPPFNTGKEFRDKKTGIGYSDIWHWDADAKDRFKELKQTPSVRFSDGKNGKKATLMGIKTAKKIDGTKSMASYLTWCALLLIECRRVMGSYEYEKQN